MSYYYVTYFENFRSFALNNYSLDPNHYMTLPSFAWDACLRYTGVKLQLLKDSDMYMFFEQGIRGGISMISHRYSKANNKYLEGVYNKLLETIYIMYLDANNLYGWTMVQKLPVSGLSGGLKRMSWLTLGYGSEGDLGYVLEVDLDYPSEIHDLHSDYPLAPENMRI